MCYTFNIVMALLSQHVNIFSAVTRNLDLKAAYRLDLITFCKVSVIDYLLGVPRMSRTDKGITQMAQPILVLRLDDYMQLNKDSSSVQVLALFYRPPSIGHSPLIGGAELL